MNISPGALSKECRAALSRAFMRSNPNASLDAREYMSDPRQNLIEGVRFEDVEGDIGQGDGSELDGDGRSRPAKFLAAHSSTALAVNIFGPFKRDPSALRLPWGGSFAGLHFERKCPHGVGHGKPPNLDVLLESPDEILGIESKCLEPIGNHKAEFKSAYDADLRGVRRETPWFREIKRLTADAGAYRRLDAAQLLKHALGLAFSFPGRAATLAYLFWEPSNAGEYPLFSEHRSELIHFAAAIAGGGPDFVWMSYPELWDWWDGLPGASELLGPHIRRLRGRYDFAVDQVARPST